MLNFTFPDRLHRLPGVHTHSCSFTLKDAFTTEIRGESKKPCPWCSGVYPASEDKKFELLQEYYGTVVRRDIIERFRVKNVGG
jgi:hypothetical protein